MMEPALFSTEDLAALTPRSGFKLIPPHIEVGSYVRIGAGDRGRVVAEIPSFGLLWLVKVERRIGFELLTARGSALLVLS